MSVQLAGRVMGAASGERLSVLGVGIRMIAAAEDTGGACSIFEVRLPPGGQVPRHVHTREDEHLVVVSGGCEIEVGGEHRVVGPGGSAVMPRGVPHGFRNAWAGEAKVLVVATPGHFEEFFRAMAAAVPGTPGDEDMEVVKEVCAEFGMTLM